MSGEKWRNFIDFYLGKCTCFRLKSLSFHVNVCGAKPGNMFVTVKLRMITRHKFTALLDTV